MTVTARESPGEYAAYWGSDTSGDRPSRKYGDGAMFYNFAEEGHDPEFLWKFMPAINRTLSSDEIKPGDAKQLRSLKQICRERLIEHYLETLPPNQFDRGFLPKEFYDLEGEDGKDVTFVTTRVSNYRVDTIRGRIIDGKRQKHVPRPRGRRAR